MVGTKNLTPLVRAASQYLGASVSPELLVRVLRGQVEPETADYRTSPWFGKARAWPEDSVRECVAHLIEPVPRRTQYWTVSQVTELVDESLRPVRDREFWVKAELSGIQCKDGRFSCELLETRAGRPVARLRAWMLPAELRKVSRDFAGVGLKFEPDEGVVLGFRCRLSFHPLYGLSLQILQADPAATLGELEHLRQILLESIRKRGLGSLNRARPLPLVPNRIGLIASPDSAAYHDFLKTLTDASAYGVQIWFAGARMQGRDAQPSILRALRHLRSLNVELIILVRGGGSRADLADLDRESLAVALAHCSVQVWTGIGHETDTSVLDVVAARAFRTPTAAARALVEHFEQMERRLQQARAVLQRASQYQTRRLRERLDACRALYVARVKGGLESRTVRLQERKGRLVAAARLELLRFQLQEWSRSLTRNAARLLVAHQAQAATRLTRLQNTRPVERLVEEQQSLVLRKSELLEGIRRRVEEQQRFLTQCRRNLQVQRWLERLLGERARLHSGRGQLSRCCRTQLHALQATLAERQARFRKERYLARLDTLQSALRAWEQGMRAGDPFARGFSLLYNTRGELIRSIAGLQPGELLAVRVQDGWVHARAEETEALDATDNL